MNTPEVEEALDKVLKRLEEMTDYEFRLAINKGYTNTHLDVSSPEFLRET